MAGFTGLKIDTWPRWVLLTLSGIALFGIGFFAQRTWGAIEDYREHKTIATLSFESLGRTINDLNGKQEKLDARQEAALLKLIELETRIQVGRERP